VSATAKPQACGKAKSRAAKRIVVGVVGGTITLAGIALLVLPGPAFVVIPIGLSILAGEFVWAKRYLRKCRQVAVRLRDKVKRKAAAAAPGFPNKTVSCGRRT
jgi:tellurite resistance protein TerC